MLLAILLTVASLSHTAELNLGLYTTHVNVDFLNEDNRLIGLSLGRYEIGTYFNSYKVRSYYGARRFEFNDSIGVMVGGVTGYSWDCVLVTGVCSETDAIPMFATYWRITDHLTRIEMGPAIMLTVSVPLGE